MAVILITGAEGQLGNELKVVTNNYINNTYLFTDIDTLDLTSAEQTKAYISESKPDWIINCAAYNTVDKAESEPEAAMLVNATAVKNITDAIHGSECKLIHMSSDYVYDGKSNVPYGEGLPVYPLSVYGKSKLAGEKYAMSHFGSMVIRTSWLYSSFGKNFVKSIIGHAAEKKSLNVVYDQAGSPTYAADMAETIMKIISGVIRKQIAFNAGIYNYSNEGVCTWYDLATEIVLALELKCQIIPILTREYPLPAKRPAYSVMNKSKIKENYGISIPHWRSSLLKCIELLK